MKTTNKPKSVGEEFIEWARYEYGIQEVYNDRELNTMADKINDIIYNRAIELLANQKSQK